MAAIWEKITESCNFLFDELYDERTRDSWPSAGTLATILISYLYFCMKVGPAWMKDRTPFDLTRVIFCYNVFQIIINTYLFYEGSYLFIFEYDLTCQPVDYEHTPLTTKVHNLFWIYMVSKVIELLDTVFFVLRKKSRQISSLHLYHHFMMPICGFMGFKYFPNGHSASLGVINCFVHMVMYTYYLIAGLGPQYQKLLWWKKHVTVLQIVQFFLVFVHNMLPLFNGCNYPKWINATLSLCALHFIYMFGNFYYVNYIKASSKSSTKAQKVHNLFWIYMVSKVIELLDTVFFVLRKKSRQISSLHLYHHFMMPICGFMGFKYFPNGHSASLGVINCFVHMVMYTYYLIAGLGPQYQKLLWWKKHVTVLQIVQFFLVFVHNMLPLFNGCNYPKWINATLSLCALHFIYMFGNFYYVNYIKASSKSSTKAQKVN